MSIPKMIIIFFEVLLLLVFIIPAFLNIINVGNIAGAFASLLILLATIFNSQLWEFIKRMLQNISGRIFVSIIAVVLAFIIGFAGFLTVRMICAINNKPDDPCTVVVLGCHVKGTEPSLMLARRLDAAYDYMIENPDVKCIVSGGQGSGEDISEADAMKLYLMNKGIDSERILKEDKSTNTLENISFSNEVLKENKIGSEIVIVTDGFHQYRASHIAEKLGLDSYSTSCHTRPELVPTYWVREWFALANEIFLN